MVHDINISGQKVNVLSAWRPGPATFRLAGFVLTPFGNNFALPSGAQASEEARQ